MKKHLSNGELKNYADGNYPVSELFDISKHITQCVSCKNNLKNIAPDFFTVSDKKIGEISDINIETHFSDNEILAFLKGEPSLKYRLKMSEHFRICEDCKSKVLQANPNILLQTVSTYLRTNEEPEEKTFFSTINALIPIGVMSVLLAGTLFYVLFVGVKSDVSDALLTKNTDSSGTSSVSSDISVNENTEPVYPDSNTTKTQEIIDKSNYSSRNNISEVLPKANNFVPKAKKILIPKTETKSKINKIDDLSDSDKIILAKSRSANNNPECKSENNLITDVEPFSEKVDKQPTFRWKSIPNAVKYNLYISDSSQVLIEEAETEKETTYTLKKTLEQNKSYKWIVIATMPDGETISSLPIYFLVGKSLQTNQSKINCKQ